MTFADQEIGEYSGQPVELYTFVRQATIWRYTSSDEDKVLSGHTFTAVPISRNAIEQTMEMARSNINLNMAKTVPFLSQFRYSPPTSVTTLTVQRYHEGLEEFITIWIGRVINVKFTEREAEVRCEPIYTSLKRPVLRLRYQTTCPHVLYGNACLVNRSNYAFSATLLSNNGTSLTAGEFASHPDGFFTGGYIDYESEADVQRRFIVSHTGQTIELNLPFSTLPGGATMTAYPGCDHLLATCHNKFNNEDNYGGQPFYPGKNPFNGTSIF